MRSTTSSGAHETLHGKVSSTSPRRGRLTSGKGQSGWYHFWPALAVFLVGFVLLAFGIWRGEVTVVLHKAIKICLECIGIG